MKKVAVVFWSGTGNTEQMANAVADGVAEAGAEVKVFTAGEFTDADVEKFDAIAFGCPAMGDEELEDSEFLPMFESCKPKLAGKPIALFGSYSWADGEWMRKWEAESTDEGLTLACPPVICFEAPDDDGVTALKKLAEALSK